MVVHSSALWNCLPMPSRKHFQHGLFDLEGRCGGGGGGGAAGGSGLEVVVRARW